MNYFWLNHRRFPKTNSFFRGNIEVKTNILVFTFKDNDAFLKNNLRPISNGIGSNMPFVIDPTKLILDSSGLGALVQTAKE